MKFSVKILGCSSATPTKHRNPSAQVVTMGDRMFLIDCGEGTQMQLRKYGVKFQRIEHIFISHLHGDHYLGLAGLLFTMHLLGRSTALHVYGNSVLMDISRLQLEVSATALVYPLVFHALEPEQSAILFEDELIKISSFPLVHRVPTHGFRFEEKHELLHLNRERIEKLHIPFGELARIKRGGDYVDIHGKLHENASLTLKREPPKVFAYCSDTAYSREIVPHVAGADLLYHETTFMHDMEATAAEKQHSTTRQAAEIALEANAKKLLIGHFSARYDDLMPLLEETRGVFERTELAMEGESYEV